MTLARTWRRQLFGASGVAVLAPATIVSALVLLAWSGGFGALGTLGQAFSGPSLPAQSAVSAAHVTPAPLISARTAAATGAARLGVGARLAGRASAAPGAGPQPAGGGQLESGGGTSGRTGGGKPAGAPGSGGSRGPGAPGASPPHPAPTVVDRVVGIATGVSRGLPGPLGPATTQTLQALGQTLDGVGANPPHVRLP